MDAVKQVLVELLQMPFVRSALIAVVLFALSGILGGLSAWMFRLHRQWRQKQSGGKSGTVNLDVGQTSLLFFASIGGIGAVTSFALTGYYLMMVVKTLKIPDLP